MSEQLNRDRINHLEELVVWAKNKTSQDKTLFLVESLAPLVLGNKPSVLLNVCFENAKEWAELKELLTQQKAFHIEEIRELNGRLQVIFYQRELLDSLLRQEPVLEFLKALSYPKDYSLDVYLSFLKQKILSHLFPHEIGVFLGYPLKDVLGFMGLIPLPYIRTQGWRIYGDEKISNEVYESNRKARSMMRKLAQI